MDTKRHYKEIRRDRGLADMDIEGRLDSLLGVHRYLMQSLVVVERERDNARDRTKLLVRRN